LKALLHEQGREIDALKQENKVQNKKIAQLEMDLQMERTKRDGEMASLTTTIKTEVEERIFNDQYITNVIDKEREINAANLQGLREEFLLEQEWLRKCLTEPMSIYFNAYRDTAYDRGGEEILKYDGVTLNAGRGLNPASGIFIAPQGGTYLFTVHLATHREKKALISLRKNGKDVASIIGQDHGKNDRNHMMGQSVLLHLNQADEVYVYAYTGTWTADWPYNHFTQFIGILLRPEQLSSWDKLRDYRDTD